MLPALACSRFVKAESTLMKDTFTRPLFSDVTGVTWGFELSEKPWGLRRPSCHTVP